MSNMICFLKPKLTRIKLNIYLVNKVRALLSCQSALCDKLVPLKPAFPSCDRPQSDNQPVSARAGGSCLSEEAVEMGNFNPLQESVFSDLYLFINKYA